MKSSAVKFHQFGIPTSLFLASTLAVIFTHPALAQRACVRTDAGKVVCGNLIRTNSGATTPKPNQRQSLRVEDKYYSFELQSCDRSDDNIKCYFMITNTRNANKNLSLTRPSRIITASGEEIRAIKTQVGQSSSATLIPGVPMKAILVFGNVPRQVSNLPVLEINYRGEFTELGNVQFRNVTIQSK